MSLFKQSSPEEPINNEKLKAAASSSSDTEDVLDPKIIAEMISGDGTLLYKVLSELYPDHQGKLTVIATKQPDNNFSISPDVILTLLDLFNISSASNAFNNSAESPAISLNQVLIKFLQLLNAFEIPPVFEPRVQQLKKQLQSNPSIELFNTIIDKYIQLFQEIKKHLQLEQLETTNLLSSLSEQFTELGLKASGASYAAQISAKQRNLLDESVSTQMSDLQKSSSEATTLETLKQLVTSRLVNIRNEIQDHLKNQELQRQETEKQLNELSLKLKTLEAESTDLKSKLSVAYNKATRDTLTNLPNRRAYEEALSIEIARWQRYQAPFTLAIWDIDLFKSINDSYGHKVGDHTLIQIARLLPQFCRKTDFVARFGGEEFVMLLPNTTEQSALILANKIRKIIEETPFRAIDSDINITISCGISQFFTDDTEERVFERADRALYQAKANGRNQCIIAQ